VVSSSYLTTFRYFIQDICLPPALGYWVRISRTRQGIASRVAVLLAHYAFEHLGLVRVEIVVAVGNRASQRVAQKVGAVREGILRNRMVVGENVYDAVMYSLIPQDLGMEAG
jgi:RimJ/RimL family protein N-acetyltransferase